MAGLQPDQPHPNGSSHDSQDDTTSNKPCPEADRSRINKTNQTINQSQSTQTETAQADDHEAWANWVYPPEFYDRLSLFHLTEGALAELDRRNRLTQHRPRPPQPQETASVLLRAMPRKRDLGRFARHGGPDLKDVRNYPPPKSSPTNCVCNVEPSFTTSTAAKTKKSTPYDADFEQHLKDHNVQPTYESQKPTNWVEIRAALNQRRPSLTSSQFSEGAFNTFQKNDALATSGDTLMTDVIPVILGEGALIADRQASQRNMLFNNVAPLTDGTITQPKPDIYYGARPEELSRAVRDALSRSIMPSTVQSRPLAPNFFVDVKSPYGTVAVLLRQVRYDGAIGSRAMHSLQNYGKEEPMYDGQAYSFSSIYYGGALIIFAHHVTATASEGGQLQYHMTQLRSFSLINGRETFVEGVTAFRNARDLAKMYRDGFVHTANERGGSAMTVVDAQDDGQREGADKTRKPTIVLADESTVASTTSSVTKKETKRKRPSTLPERSGPLTRAAKRRLRSSGEM